MKKLFILLSVLFYSCSEKPEQMAQNILPKDEMVQLLADLHIIDAAFNTQIIQSKKLDVNLQQLYNDACSKRFVTRAQFDSSFSYYTKHLKEMNEIYEELINELSRRQAKPTQ